MKLTVKYHGELAEYFPNLSDEKITFADIGIDDSITSLMDKFSIPEEKINLVLVNGVKVGKENFTEHRFADGDTLAIWPIKQKD